MSPLLRDDPIKCASESLFLVDGPLCADRSAYSVRLAIVGRSSFSLITGSVLFLPRGSDRLTRSVETGLSQSWGNDRKVRCIGHSVQLVFQ